MFSIHYLVIPTTTTTKPLTTTSLCVWLFEAFLINGIIPYVSFLNVWLFSLRAIFCISINITEAIGALFLVINKQCFVLLDRAHFFIHYFLAFATVNTSAIKIYQQFFAWASVCGYSEWKARSGTAGSWGHSLFSTQRLQCCSPQKQHHLTFLPAAHRADSFSKFFLVLLLKS